MHAWLRGRAMQVMFAAFLLRPGGWGKRRSQYLLGIDTWGASGIDWLLLDSVPVVRVVPRQLQWGRGSSLPFLWSHHFFSALPSSAGQY